MDINQRIRYLRKDLKLSQGEFGEKIGLKHGAISRLEKSGNTVIDQNISLICNVFNVEEQWLRTGEGQMYRDNLVDPPFLFGDQNISPEQLEMIQTFLALPQEQQNIILQAIGIIGKVYSKINW